MAIKRNRTTHTYVIPEDQLISLINEDEETKKTHRLIDDQWFITDAKLFVADTGSGVGGISVTVTHMEGSNV